jgi:hypothetical protein
MWRDEGTWIAWGASTLFLVTPVTLHRLFVRILKDGATAPAKKENHE